MMWNTEPPQKREPRKPTTIVYDSGDKMYAYLNIGFMPHLLVS